MAGLGLSVDSALDVASGPGTHRRRESAQGKIPGMAGGQFRRAQAQVRGPGLPRTHGSNHRGQRKARRKTPEGRRYRAQSRLKSRRSEPKSHRCERQQKGHTFLTRISRACAWMLARGLTGCPVAAPSLHGSIQPSLKTNELVTQKSSYSGHYHSASTGVRAIWRASGRPVAYA